MSELPVSAYGHHWKIELDPASHIGAIVAEGNKPYEWDMLSHIAQQRFSGAAIDVGAHVGNHALFMAVVCALEVYAFEPLFSTELVANIERNNLRGRIHAFGVALGAERGSARDSGQRVITHPNGDGTQSEGMLIAGEGPVEVHPLDEYQLGDVAVVKVDVEGMEPEVLRGGEATIRCYRPVLYLEARTEHDHDQLAHVLKPWGYIRTERWGRLTPREEWRHRRTL